jgi:hypothetical protein
MTRIVYACGIFLVATTHVYSIRMRVRTAMCDCCQMFIDWLQTFVSAANLAAATNAGFHLFAAELEFDA